MSKQFRPAVRPEDQPLWRLVTDRKGWTVSETASRLVRHLIESDPELRREAERRGLMPTDTPTAA